MNKKAFDCGRAFRAGMDYALRKRGIAMDDWVTLQNKEGEYYHVDLAGNQSDSSKGKNKNEWMKKLPPMPDVEVMPPNELKSTITRTIKGMVRDGTDVSFKKTDGRMISYNGVAVQSQDETFQKGGFYLNIKSAKIKGNPIVEVEMEFPASEEKNPKVQEFIKRVSHVINNGHRWKNKGSSKDGQRFWEGYKN